MIFSDLEKVAFAKRMASVKRGLKSAGSVLSGVRVIKGPPGKNVRHVDPAIDKIINQSRARYRGIEATKTLGGWAAVGGAGYASKKLFAGSWVDKNKRLSNKV